MSKFNQYLEAAKLRKGQDFNPPSGKDIPDDVKEKSKKAELDFKTINQILDDNGYDKIDEDFYKGLGHFEEDEILDFINSYYNKHKKSPAILNILAFALESARSENPGFDEEIIKEGNISEKEFDKLVKRFKNLLGE